MMTFTWSWFFNSHTLLGRPSHGLDRNIFVIVARGAEEDRSSVLKKGDSSSVAIGVIFCLFLLSLIGLAIFYFFKRQKQQAGDVEAGNMEKRNWWMVDDKNEKKTMDWWRLSHQIPARVEPPKSATGTRTSLQRLKSALTRKGALRGLNNDHAPVPPPKLDISTIPSPTITIDLPMQAVPQTKPRYPSILERGYRVPLYPVQSPPKDLSPPRSLTSPNPIIVAERSSRRKIPLPPRVLKISNGRPLVLTERKTGVPRSPANRRRDWLARNQFKHPFLPLKDSDTPFPTISLPMPSSETELTNPKLGYTYSMSKPRTAPSLPSGPRLARASTRRVPVPVYETVARPPMPPPTPLQLREDVRVLPPGQSPKVPRPMPTPI